MSAVQLFGDSRSGNCYKVALLLHLTQTPFDWVETDVMQGRTRTTDFLALNPNGRVPLLLWPDGRTLAESNAMLLHLSRGSSYFPEDPWKQAQVWQWLFFEQYSHEPYIAVVRFVVCFARREVEEAERVAGLREKGYQALAVMEKTLQDSPFFVGEQFSVADIALYAYTHVAEEGGFDLKPYPQVRNWLARVQAQPGFLPMGKACS
jgi:glutathione S-transferase